MNIAIVGTGYVGLVSGTCFSDMGINVTCVDIDPTKIDNLHKGIIPIYEPGLDEMVRKNVQAGRLKFTTDLTEILDEAEVVFIAVGTPPDEDGSADLKYVLAVAKTIGENITNYTVVVTKSTVPVGTSRKVKSEILSQLSNRNVNIDFDVASNPEFLKEGAAIKDFMSPDRVVVGVESDKARSIMAKLYKPFMLVNDRLIFTNIPSAEMIKYAANSMLATRISFMNDIANLCELVGADVNMVRKGIGSDSRIGNKFLYAGCGYGGSCFPKDVKALVNTAKKYGYDMEVIKAVENVNIKQKSVPFNKLMSHYNGNISGKTITLWGLSFKPETDDMREATSLVLIDKILSSGGIIKAYDPISMNVCKSKVGDKITYCKDMYEAAVDSDAIILVTEWKEFRMPSLPVLDKAMRSKVIIDGRNIYDAEDMKANGFIYKCIGSNK